MKEMETMTTSNSLAMRKSGRLPQIRTIAGIRRRGVTLTTKDSSILEGWEDLKEATPGQNKGKEVGTMAETKEQTKAGVGQEGMAMGAV